VPDNNSGQLPSSVGIGSLRWRVTLYRRDQAPDPGLGIKETLVRIATVQSDIQPTYPSTFYNSVASDPHALVRLHRKYACHHALNPTPRRTNTDAMG
jgi:hypothetical protein